MVIGLVALLAIGTGTSFSADPPARGQESGDTRKSWAEYQIIDIHAHIGNFREYDLSLPTLLHNVDGYGVRLALVSNIDGAELPGITPNLDETKANAATSEVVHQHPDKFRGLAWTRPEDGSAEKIEPFLKDSSLTNGNPRVFVGLKFHPDMNHYPADDPRMDAYLRLCEKYHLTAVFHCGASSSNSGPEKIYAAARRHPTVPVILYHMGFRGAHADAIRVAREALTKKDAQLYLETAQAEPKAVLQAIKELGSDRVLFGTDACYFGREHYARYEDLVARLKKELSAEDFAKVMHGNAEKLFKLTF